ncbi:hypothetical protein [Synechococcus sp. MW101C3]|uniref:hypothetical protein n=1 Tax=Synechococcus sp. MW101C3 TaxID=210768 RepID=UPI0011819E63|nr:hypothetical protein [Synechococcus sp. MW101C3]
MTSEASIDLPLDDCCSRWGISRKAVKSRASALGVDLIRESSTRTVWPGDLIPLGDQLHQHLQRKGCTLSNFLASAQPAATTSVSIEALSVMPSTGTNDQRKALTLPPATAGSESILALAALVAAIQPAPRLNPLAVARGLAEAAKLGAWITSDELAHLLGLSRSTVSSWSTSHSPRPGFMLERRKVGVSVWWKVIPEPKPKKGKPSS